MKKGLPVDEFAGQLSFFFNVHSDFFEEIAKFRAARSIWAKIMRDRFGAKDPRSWMLRFHSQTAGSTLTAQQPMNNVVRVALQALSSVLGGTQSLHTNSLDEALALPTEESARLALRTQQIIASETGVTHTVDPLAGSYLIENLTAELERRCFETIAEMDRLGGTVKCIENGWVQNEILNSAYSDQRAIDEGRIKVVGLNCFKDESKGAPIDILRIPPELEAGAVARTRAWRAKRNQAETDRSLRALEEGAKTDSNIMGLVMESARAGATLGEISDTLRKVFGQYQEYAGF
jgi:methylmalonyl-CoA mutase N-terminal domain/subunit